MRSAPTMARRATIAGVAWAACTAWLLVRGVGAREACSASVGSGELVGSPCDLVGWVEAVAILGGAAVWTVATVSGAWRWAVPSLLNLGACAGLPVLGVLALGSVAPA
ncbi:MAG: hypothetical protein KF703_03755 [Actinobacteria bacterium]|nr:hypothetical protein [Actinomycetota bacterium]